MIRFASALALISLATPAAAQETWRLYPGTAPGSEKWTYPLVVQDRPDGSGKAYTNVRDPELTAHLPDPAKANGAAVVLLPGGALRLLGIGVEASDTIRRFNAEGIAVFVLKYRTLQIAPQPAGAAPSRPAAGFKLPKLEIRNGNANPSPDDAALNEVLRLATDDAQVALHQLRRDAARWKIDPKRIGFIGSSAGGGVGISTIMENEAGAAPDFLISLYGPSLTDVTVRSDAPPLFMATESDHGPVTDGLLALFSLWKAAGRKAELHVFEVPNFRMPAALWLDRCVDWMREQKLIPAAKPAS